MRTTLLVTSLALFTSSAFAQVDDDGFGLGQLPPGGEGTWQPIGQGISDLNVLCCTIAFNSQNVAHVAFQDMSLPNGQASVMRYVNGHWEYVGPKGSGSSGRAWYNRMAFDADDNLYIASRDYGASGRINVRRYRPSLDAWDTLGPNGSSPDEAHWTDLAIGSDGFPYVVYADRSTAPWDRPTTMRYEVDHWVVIGGFGLSPTKGDYPTIQLDAANIPYVAFADQGYTDQYGNGRISVMRYRPQTSDWEYVGTPGFSSLGGLNVRMAFDKNDTPYVVYQEYHVRLHVLKYDSGLNQWVELGTSASGADQPTVETEPWRQWISLDFDSQNTPYVAYQMLYNQRKATVRKWTGTTWVTVGDPSFSQHAADYMSMAVDKYDRPWVVYRDRADGDRLTVMRYAEPVITYCDATVNSQGCQATLTTIGEPSVSNPGAFTIEADNVINGRLGVMLYSSFPDRQPFGQSGIMCLQSPWRRGGFQNSGGNSGAADCSGSLSMSFNPPRRPIQESSLGVGMTYFAQYAYHDSALPGGMALTNAVQFVLGN